MEIVEIENHWFVAVHRMRYDDRNELSILGSGETREEALISALNHTVELCNQYDEIICVISKVLNTSHDVNSMGRHVKVPGYSIEINGQMIDCVDAVIKNEYTKEFTLRLR